MQQSQQQPLLIDTPTQKKYKQCVSTRKFILFFILFATIVLFEMYTYFELNTVWCMVSSILSTVCILAAYLWFRHVKVVMTSQNNNRFLAEKIRSNPTGSIVSSFVILGGVCILSLGLLMCYLHFFGKNNTTQTKTQTSLLLSCCIMVLITSIGMYFYLPGNFRLLGVLFTLLTLGTIYFVLQKDYHLVLYSLLSIVDCNDHHFNNHNISLYTH
jgi:hypothetical protein